MVEQNVVERYVDQVLEVNGFCRGDKEQLRLLLHHLYTAATMFHLMTAEQQALIGRIQQQLAAYFVTKIVLKERKRRAKKRNIPPTPPNKEKNIPQEKDEKTRIRAARREQFHQECLAFVGVYDTQLLSDFYNYWSEENVKTGLMRYEDESHWNTERRLKRWMKNQYATATTIATMRLEKARKGKSAASGERRQLVAAERDDANERLFRQIEENKSAAVTWEEYLAKKNAKNE